MSYNKGLVATLTELEEFYRGEDAGNVIELMNQTNDILTDIPFMEANQSDGHTTSIRTGLPAVYWRRLYKGTPPSKSQYSQVKEVCGMLEALMELDAKEVGLYRDNAAAFRLSEAKAFAESMRQKVASTIFYGDNNANADEFNGLAARYPSLSSPNVINAGGTSTASSKLTSMWLICWGADTVHGIYPKGSAGGIKSENLGKYMTFDGDGNKFQVIGDKYNWDCGLAVRDWRACVRICNIDTSKLTLRKSASGFIDLQGLTIQAKNKMPSPMRSKAIWYANAEIIGALEQQSMDSGSVHLLYGEYFNAKAVPILHGRPIRQCDAIVCNEDEVV